jgi:hypothetical protein
MSASLTEILRHGKSPPRHHSASLSTDGGQAMTLVTQMTQPPGGHSMPESNHDEAPRPALNPTALPLGDAAKLLTRVGGRAVTAEMLQADIDAGATTNADGTLNLVHYAAWLVKEVSGGE